MFHYMEIRPKKESRAFCEELALLLSKHDVTMLYGANHIEFHKGGNASHFAQCFCVNGASRTKFSIV